LFFLTVPSANTLVRWVNESAFVSIVQARPCPTFGRPVHLRGSPHRLRPGSSPHAFRIPSRDGHPALRRINFIPRPARHYPRFWIWPSSSECQKDFNLPEQRAAQHTLRHSPTSPVRSCPPCGLWPSQTGLGRWTKTCTRSPGSRACCFSACAGSQTTQDRTIHSRLAWLLCCLPPLGTQSASCSIGFSKLNSPAHRYLCLRFKRYLAISPARLEARMDSLLFFPVGLFSSPTTYRFIPALPELPTTRKLAGPLNTSDPCTITNGRGATFHPFIGSWISCGSLLQLFTSLCDGLTTRG